MGLRAVDSNVHQKNSLVRGFSVFHCGWVCVWVGVYVCECENLTADRVNCTTECVNEDSLSLSLCVCVCV